MHLAFLGIAIILFVIAAILELLGRTASPPPAWASFFVTLGFVFLSASFWPGLG